MAKSDAHLTGDFEVADSRSPPDLATFFHVD